MLVSHNTRQIERICTRVILMDHGRIVADDSPGKVCDLFYERSDEKIKLSSGKGKSSRWTNTLLTDDLQVLDVELLDASGRSTDVIRYKENIAVRIRFIARKELKSPVFLVGVHTTDFLYLTRHHSERQLKVERLAAGEYEVVCRISQCPLLPGIYALLLGIGEGIGASNLFYAENLVHFQVRSPAGEPLAPGDRDGFFALDARWSAPKPVQSSATAEMSDSPRNEWVNTEGRSVS